MENMLQICLVKLDSGEYFCSGLLLSSYALIHLMIEQTQDPHKLHLRPSFATSVL